MNIIRIIIITVMMIMMTAIHADMLIKLEDIARGLYVTVLGIVGNIDDCGSIHKHHTYIEVLIKIIMSKEIERKFLVKPTWLSTRIIPFEASSRHHIVQGYLSTGDIVVRIRIIDSRSYITIKNNGFDIERSEFEYPIPFEDAKEMLCMPNVSIIEKFRSVVMYDGHKWEIDEFVGRNTGLVLAEIELKSPDELFNLPEWVGEEVTGNPKYYNVNLINKQP